MMKTNQNNHIMNMNKGMKQKLSMLLIACLLFTGYRGLTIPGRAEQGNTEQNNEISVSGTQVKVQLLGEDLRRAAKEAIEKGERVDDSVLKGYSKDEELQKSYAGIFSLDKEVYEIPLDSISEGLSESLAEEEAGLQVFVERDAQDLDNLVRKESKESLLLYDGKSQLEQLFPKGEETESVKKEEEENLASDSNLVRNTELTGSELITFLYKNKADHRITFQLSVDGNKYPKVTVSPKTQLFKELVDKLKKEEKKVPVETTKAPESKIEKSTEAKGVAPEEQLAESVTSSEEVKETAKQAASKEETTEASVTEASTEDSASKVSIVSEEKKEEASEQETSEAAEKNEESAEAETATEAPVKKESTKEVEVKFSGFLQDVINHYEEFLGELVSARFSQYSLNELGRKSQNVEIEGFATVEVFYDDEAFVDEEGKAQDVVLEAKRLVKPEEEGKKDGEKLTEEQVEAMKEHSIYEGSDALDIRFVSKNDRTKEIEPKVPVSVRLTFDKAAVPEDAGADTVAIHHIVEEKDTGKVKMVETVVRAELEKKAEEQVEARKSAGDVAKQEGSTVDAQTTYSESLAKLEKESAASEQKEGITKEFIANSFSAYIVTWQCNENVFYGIRFHYVDKNFKEIGPTVYETITKKEYQIGNNSSYNPIYYKKGDLANSIAYKTFENFELKGVGGQKSELAGAPYTAMPELVEGYVLKDGKWIYFKGMEIISIDKSEFRWNSLNPKGEYYTEFTWGCAYTDFYFIYELKTEKNKPKKKDILPILSNEKFITDNLDGTYDLTLTGQVKENSNNKQKLDVVFVYDNTAVMATGFGFNEKLKKLSEEDYVDKDSAKSTKVKNEIKKFIERLSQSDSDVRYALVTMDGDKGFGSIVEEVKAKYDSLDSIHYKNTNAILGGNEKDEQGNKDINIVGEYKGDKGNAKVWLDEATDYDGMSSGFNVSDKAYNDTKHFMGFTQNPKDIIDKLDALDEKKSTFKNGDKRTVSGENYASAMKNVKTLLRDGTEYEVAEGGLTNENSKVREDAEKIVVFIAGGNPKFATIPKKTEKEKKKEEEKKKEGKPYNYIFEDTHRYNDSDYYIIRRSYQEGWSYGNGYSINFPALNQARGELSKLTNIDAFYSIGVGAKTNWNYLNDFAMGQYYDEDGNQRTGEKYDDKKHPDRRERALYEDVLYKCFDGSTVDNLHEAFQGIYKRVARNQVQNVEISDTLTRFVQPVDTQNPTSTVVGQLVKLKANGVEVDHEVTDPQEKESLNFKGFDIKVDDDYIENGKKLWKISLKTIPEDFTLPAGYEIRAVAKIIPTVDAFEEIGKTFYNGEYHIAPISKDPHGTENIIIGDARTDLNAICKEDLNREQSDKLRYASSTGKPGLPTNTEATLSYKVNGKDENKKYNKPIINPGNMVIEKAFLGFDEGEFFKESSGLTILGKEILKTISFRISRENAAGTEELLATVSPADYLGENEDKILKLPNTNLYIKVSRVFKEYRQGAPYARAKGNPNISISIYNTPLNMKYRVKEVESSEGKIFSTGTKGYQFDKNAVRHGGQTEDLKLMDVRRNYHFFNTYKNVPREKTITIRKVVEEFGGTAFTTEARNKSFEFYIGLFSYDGNKYIPLSDEDINKYIDNKWKPNNNGRSGHGEVKNIKGNPIEFDDGRGNKINATVVRMKLKHGESLTLPIDENIYYKVFESREDGYDLAKGEMSKDGVSEPLDIREIKYDFIDFMDGKYINRKGAYSATDILSRDGEITFRNPRKTLVPTGLRGDFTPYVLSLCGFTFMAGLYLSIKKKKREEV